MYKDKILLITGGTGSFGNAILDRFLKTDIKEIRIFSRDELKQDDMRRKYNNSKLKFYIGDVRDIDSIRKAMNGVDYVYHAAALKQVPSCEFFPIEAVKTNILGTENVLNAAIEAKVEKIVCLSTDKAAYPINTMGASKMLMEKVIMAKSRNVDPKKINISCTRYGNVMASRGSVIPLFVEQIKSNKELTITDPNMTRFLMSLDDAVDLVLFAFENAENGDLMVQKAPASTIGDLAEALKLVFNYQKDNKIIGIRHGEKKYETLLTEEEKAKAIDLGDFYRIPRDNRDLNYAAYFEGENKKTQDFDSYNSNNTKRLNVDEIKELFMELDYIKLQLKE